MRVVLQRVTEARVIVGGELVSGIGRGLVALVGISSGDEEEAVKAIARRTAGLRIFSDVSGRMNLSVTDIAGEVLVISQFTLCADTSRGRRPSFTGAADPKIAEPLVESYALTLESLGIGVGRGRFGADMQVVLTNSGPVTIVLET